MIQQLEIPAPNVVASPTLPDAFMERWRVIDGRELVVCMVARDVLTGAWWFVLRVAGSLWRYCIMHASDPAAAADELLAEIRRVAR